MQCVILAGGLGTRIRSIAGDLPKSLIPINGKPFISYQLKGLRHSGIEHVVLCIGYQGNLIRHVVGDGKAWGLHVTYVDEGPSLQGTGGALRLAGAQKALEPLFFVMYGDSYLPIDFRTIWTYFYSRNELALMTVIRNEGRWDKSNACFDGAKVTCYDKKAVGIPAMVYIDYGLNLLRRDALLAHIPQEKPYDLADYLSSLSKSHQLAGYAVEQRFYEIGSPRGLQDFQTFAEKQLHHLD